MKHYNIWYNIFDSIDFKTQLAFTYICKTINNNFWITDLLDIDFEMSKKLNNELLQKVFSQATKLMTCFDKPDFTIMNDLKELEISHLTKNYTLTDNLKLNRIAVYNDIDDPDVY